MGLFKSIFKKLSDGLAKTRQTFVASLRTILTGKALSADLLKQVEQRLIQADVGVQTTRSLMDKIRKAWQEGAIKDGDQVIDYLRKELAALWPAEDRALHFAGQAGTDGQAPGGPPSGGGGGGAGPTVILVCGVNGSGKTTSIAKIAKSLRDDGKTVLLAACDTFRAAAVEQLEVWSQRLGVEVVKGQHGGDPAAVAFDAAAAAVARNFDVLLVDTAGRLHTQDHLMRQLTKIRNVLTKKIPGAPHEVILVLDATTGQNAINQARVFTQATQVTGIFLAKLDGTARGGIVVAIREQLGIPVKFIGVGETPDDVEPFEPVRFVDAMFAQA